MLKVVVINGGRGAASLIPALLAREGIALTSVVNAYDDGKSTGTIRQFFRMLGPSDLRKVQELMLRDTDPDHAANLHAFHHRFPVGCDRDAVLRDLGEFAFGSSDRLADVPFGNPTTARALRVCIGEFLSGLATSEKALGERFRFDDCALMNCIYAGAYLAQGRDLEAATLFIDRLFRLRGTVLPTNVEDRKLVALRENGEMLYTEAEIVELRSNVRIERIYLLAEVPDRQRFDALTLDEKRGFLEAHQCAVAVSAGVQRALADADVIVYAAGTQHSSLYPTYMSTGLAAAIAENAPALKVFVTNIGADYETPSYRASDYILGAYRYLGLGDRRRFEMRELFDAVLVNKPRTPIGPHHVPFDEASFAAIPVPLVLDDFESAREPGKHDGAKLVTSIFGLYEARLERGARR